MHKIREHRSRQSCVTAVFEDRALSFILRNGATLEELSDRLAGLGQQHNGWPLAITVKFGSPSRNPGFQRSRRPAFEIGVSERGVDGLRQRMDAATVERANVEHSAG